MLATDCHSLSQHHRRATFNFRGLLPKKRAPAVPETEPTSPESYQSLSVIKKISQAKFPVYLASSKIDRQMYVMKIFPYKDDKPHPYYKNEVRFSCLKHPNIINMVYSENEKETEYKDEITKVSYILMEYAPYGDFFEFVTKTRSNVDEKLVRTYFRQLIDGIEFLHTCKVAHLDLKPENLLIGADFNLKIADFDLSYVRGDRKLLSRGTKFYRAPEFFKSTTPEPEIKLPFAADIYSAGVILFILKSGGIYPHSEKDTLEGVDLVDLMDNDNSNFWKSHCEIEDRKPSYYDKSFRELFNAMVRPDPATRITISEIKKSKWYRGSVYTHSELERKMKKMLHC